MNKDFKVVMVKTEHKGLPGRDGRDGAAGRDGRDGRDGKDVLNGKVNPEANQGKDGDKHVNKKQATSSLRITATGRERRQHQRPLKGDKGEQGLQGRDGQDGSTKVYQDATDVMAQQVVTDVMDATVKTS